MVWGRTGGEWDGGRWGEGAGTGRVESEGRRKGLGEEGGGRG